MSYRTSAHRSTGLRNSVLIAGLAFLTACAEGQMPGFLQKSGGDETVARAATGGGGTVERDVEAPEVFQATEAGLWDGRPSLGGVWVAHPDVTEPERVIIRNEQNGKFVIGALFRRERQSPGPRLQVSSDAAAAVGMLAGQPTNLNVVALRREEAPAEAMPMADPMAAEGAVPSAPEVAEGALPPADPVVSGSAAAIETAALAPAKPTMPAAAITSTDTPQATPAAAPAPKPAKASGLSRPYVQIGIFSVEQNAENTAVAMRQEGMVPTVKKQNSQGKTFWRVVVGPAQDKGEMDVLLKKIKGSGFTDAYAVSN
ncbi:SPOR domain-containing protein [Thetidibacter halocola]|uniref:SPOR domain-containing protein n=1 Tax=Thetidibacter halocola TaxID=2827239 RepID=A0A8J7WHJ3_9RHOB|nr:SPOR domain-containing protein [Thetidibacter halocola]MBS0126554.1 SPOR domain-containing protein [Thetidibacter halocola]